MITEYYDDFSRDINQYYLDTQTGETIVIDGYLKSQWEDGEEIIKEELPEWQQKEYDTMMAVFNDFKGRFEEIPSVDPGESTDIMRRFVRTVKNQKIADELSDALYGPKSFRRFPEVLSRYHQVRNDYYEFREQCYLESLKEWLNDLGIEPDWNENP